MVQDPTTQFILSNSEINLIRGALEDKLDAAISNLQENLDNHNWAAMSLILETITKIHELQASITDQMSPSHRPYYSLHTSKLSKISAIRMLREFHPNRPGLTESKAMIESICNQYGDSTIWAVMCLIKPELVSTSAS